MNFDKLINYEINSNLQNYDKENSYLNLKEGYGINVNLRKNKYRQVHMFGLQFVLSYYIKMENDVHNADILILHNEKRYEKLEIKHKLR